MADKIVKIPGPDHPISIEANPSRVVVEVGGRIIVDTRNALTLREASYAAVQYIPRRDVDMAALVRSEHTTYCPYKGDASSPLRLPTRISAPAPSPLDVDQSARPLEAHGAPDAVLSSIPDADPNT